MNIREKKLKGISTILQSDSSVWLELRRNLLTASNFGKIIKRRSNISCSNIVRDLIYKKPIDHVKSIKHGREKEAIAKQQLEKEKNIKFRPVVYSWMKKSHFLVLRRTA